MDRYILWMMLFVLLLPAGGSSNDDSPLAETAGLASGRVLYGNIYGTIHAAGTGLPVTGARVRVMDANAAGATLRDSVSGHDGSYLMNAIPINGISRTVTVVIEAAGLDPVTVRDAVVLPGALMALQIDMSMTATGSSHMVEGRETSAIVTTNQYRHELRKSLAAKPTPKDGDRLTSYDDYPLRLTIFATRLGMVEATTANGHVIRAYDHFVALPSLDVLCRKGGYEYEVRVEYDGYAETAPVWDVGPWNIHDNYWEPERYRTIYDYLSDGGYAGGLGQGVPEAEAAHELNFNSSRDEFGRIVTDPSGIDLADGVFWDGLDMHENDWVSVEYLWMDNHHHDDDDDVYVSCFIHCAAAISSAPSIPQKSFLP